jgi:2-polyprenyl-3-methyl-5-hydroxy-6-metoxy-1,4-benzoquinol methylase
MTEEHRRTPCPLCGATDVTPVLAKHGYCIQRCVACRHIHVNPMPTDAQLTEHYQNPAYFEGEQDQGYRSYEDMHRALLPHFRRRLQKLSTRHPGQGSLLDFGCADGYFLQQAQAANWKIHGVELSADMAAKASKSLGITIAQSLESAPAHDLDAITLWEVIEHVPRPIEQIAEFRKRLKPGGVLMFSTPNTGHWQAVRKHDAWVSYRPPSHVQYFTAASAEDLLRRAGFTQIEVTRTMPLPPMPEWLDRASKPLYEQLSTGRATGNWQSALWMWRAIRAGAWAWQKLTKPSDDIFATLEVIATRP